VSQLAVRPAYKRFSFICFVMAVAHVLAASLCVILVREGNLLDVSPIKLLRFIPEHGLLWRLSCFSMMVASLTFVTFVVAAREVIDQKAASLATLAVVFVAIAASNDLNGLCSMMVVFPDLAFELKENQSFLVHETIQLSWATMDQALSQCLLIGNTLYSAAGMLVVGCAFLTPSFPRWLAWSGAPIWFVTLAVSVCSFLGMLQWVIMITLATVLVFVVWCTALGISYQRLADRLVTLETVC